jgi:hypothetical protein
MTMNRELVTEALATVAAEYGNLDRTFDLARQLVNAYGQEDLAERLYADLPADGSWEGAAVLYHAIFWVLQWQGRGDDTRLMESPERWLHDGTDLGKVRIVLHVEVYPFDRPAEMERVLRRVAARQPAVAERCRELIAARREAGV